MFTAFLNGVPYGSSRVFSGFCLLGAVFGSSSGVFFLFLPRGFLRFAGVLQGLEDFL